MNDPDTLLAAAAGADWEQVVRNGGPPCFHLEDDGKFCLRTKQWQGHDMGMHSYVPLGDLLTAFAYLRQCTDKAVPQGPQDQTVMFFPNGNTAVLAGGAQVCGLQESWLVKFIEF